MVQQRASHDAARLVTIRGGAIGACWLVDLALRRRSLFRTFTWILGVSGSPLACLVAMQCGDDWFFTLQRKKLMLGIWDLEGDHAASSCFAEYLGSPIFASSQYNIGTVTNLSSFFGSS